MLDAEIRGFFDNLDRERLVEFVERRIGDRRVVRLIRKWLKAGVLEEGEWKLTQTGRPQGDVFIVHYADDCALRREADLEPAVMPGRGQPALLPEAARCDAMAAGREEK